MKPLALTINLPEGHGGPIYTGHIGPPHRTSREVLELMVLDVREGILKLPGVTVEQADDRARNIVAGLVGNYRIEGWT